MPEDDYAFEDPILAERKWWLLDIPIIHNNAVDGTFDGRETAPLGPPGLTDDGFVGEIAAVNRADLMS